MKLRSSPYYILVFVRKFALMLLALPLQTLLMINSGLHTKLFFISADILVFTTILLCAVISLRSIRLCTDASRFVLQKGVLLRQALTFERRKIQSISASRNLLQRILRVYKVTLVSGNTKGEIFLSAKNLAYLPCSLPSKKAPTHCIHKTKLADVLIMSSGLSPALGAALSFAPFARSLSKLSAEDISSANLWTVIGYKGLPPLLAAISSLLFTVWLAGTLISFLQLCNISIYKVKDRLLINSGLLSKHRTAFFGRNVSAVVFSQSPVMYLLRRQKAAVAISTAERSAHLTAGCTRQASDSRRLLNALNISHTAPLLFTIRPHSRSLTSYTLLPFLSLCTLCAFSILLSRFSPYKIEPHLGVFLCLWCCVWFVHRGLAFYRSSIILSGRVLQINTFSKLSFLRVFIPTSSIHSTKLTQNVFQRIKGTCNLRVFVRYKKKKCYTIRHLKIKKAAELSKKLCG